MNIDTLILSGGGPSGIAYIGIFKALFEKKIIKQGLPDIKEIITTSVGIIFSILYMLDLTQDQIKKIILETDLSSVIDISQIGIDNLLVDFGLFKNDRIGISIDSFCKHKLDIENITLKELYDKIPIKLTIKVYNSTDRRLEYINHLTNPDLSVSLLSQMTTAIPFFFQPVKYNDCLYVDGGIRGGLPIENCNSDNYLGIAIKGNSCSTKNNKLVEMFPILDFILSLMNEKTPFENENKKIIVSEINGGLNFDLNEEEKEAMIKLGYDSVIQHADKYFTED